MFSALASSVSPEVRSVSMTPGATALTRIPDRPSSFAADRAMFATAAFEAAYTV